MKTFLEYRETQENRLWIYECPKCGADALNGDPKNGSRYRGSAKCQQCGHGFSTIVQTPVSKNGPIIN